MTPGGERNSQKTNRRRRKTAKNAEIAARADIVRLKILPVNQRTLDHKQLLNEAEGRLKKALARQKKSENPSRKGKGVQ